MHVTTIQIVLSWFVAIWAPGVSGLARPPSLRRTVALTAAAVGSAGWIYVLGVESPSFSWVEQVLLMLAEIASGWAASSLWIRECEPLRRFLWMPIVAVPALGPLAYLAFFEAPPPNEFFGTGGDVG